MCAGARSPEQVIRVFSGQVQVSRSCAVMAELHCGEEQLGDRRHLGQQEHEAKRNWKSIQKGCVRSTEGPGGSALKQDNTGHQHVGAGGTSGNTLSKPQSYR